jgi:NADH-quinone oxidoreductase subunit L
VSPTTWGWLVIAFPLAGMLVTALGWRNLSGRSAGWIGTGAILGSFVASVGALVALLGHDAEERVFESSLFDYVKTVGVNAD